MAVDRLVELLPATFRADWAIRVGKDGVGQRTGAAPDLFGWTQVDKPIRLSSVDDNVLAAAPTTGDEFVVIARRGGPEILDSELARLGHLVALAVSISRS